MSQKVQDQMEKRIQLNIELRVKMENEILPIVSETVKLLNEENERLQNHLEAIKQNQNQVDEAEKKLGTGISFQEAAVVIQEAGEACTRVQYLSAKAADFITRGEATFQRTAQIVQESVLKLKELREVLTALDEVNLNAIPDLTTLTVRKPDPNKITAENLMNMDDEVKSLLQKGLIFSVLDQQDKRRFGQIAIDSDGKVCWSCYADGLPTPGSHSIQHKDVWKLMDPHARKVFLELSVEKKVINSFGNYVNGGTLCIGKLYIHLTKDTLRAKNFFNLCTGELGPTYKGSSFFGLHDKGTGMERAQCGDYEFNNGSGGKTLVSGITKEEKVESDPNWLAGSVVGLPNATDANASQFFIRSQDIQGLNCEPSFGRVEEGIEALRKAISYFNGIDCRYSNRVFISNCGIVLNR